MSWQTQSHNRSYNIIMTTVIVFRVCDCGVDFSAGRTQVYLASLNLAPQAPINLRNLILCVNMQSATMQFCLKM